MSSRTFPIDGRSVGVGVLSGLAMAVPAIVVAQVLDSSLDDGVGPWLLVLVVAIIAAFGVAGFVAAGRSSEAPLVCGTLSGVGAYAVIQGLAILRLTISDEEVTWAAVPLFALVAAAAGLVGAMVSGARTSGARGRR